MLCYLLYCYVIDSYAIDIVCDLTGCRAQLTASLCPKQRILKHPCRFSCWWWCGVTQVTGRTVCLILFRFHDCQTCLVSFCGVICIIDWTMCLNPSCIWWLVLTRSMWKFTSVYVYQPLYISVMVLLYLFLPFCLFHNFRLSFPIFLCFCEKGDCGRKSSCMLWYIRLCSWVK